MKNDNDNNNTNKSNTVSLTRSFLLAKIQMNLLNFRITYKPNGEECVRKSKFTRLDGKNENEIIRFEF